MVLCLCYLYYYYYYVFFKTRCARTLLVRTTVITICTLVPCETESVLNIGHKSQQDHWYHIQLHLNVYVINHMYIGCFAFMLIFQACFGYQNDFYQTVTFPAVSKRFRWYGIPCTETVAIRNRKKTIKLIGDISHACII